jgi:hypothetical protein
MGSKVLDLLRVNDTEVQTLEIFEGMPIVNCNNQPLKDFAYVVNGSKQTATLKSQIEFMCYPPGINKDTLSILLSVNLSPLRA